MAGKITRLAGILLAIMFLIWVLVLDAPRVAHAMHDANVWASMLVPVSMSGAGFIIAGTFHEGVDSFLGHTSKEAFGSKK